MLLRVEEQMTNIVCAAFCQLGIPTVTQLSVLLVVSQQRLSLSSYSQWHLHLWSGPSIDHMTYMTFEILATLTQIIHANSCFLDPDCLGTVACSDNVVLIFPHKKQNKKTKTIHTNINLFCFYFFYQAMIPSSWNDKNADTTYIVPPFQPFRFMKL